MNAQTPYFASDGRNVPVDTNPGELSMFFWVRILVDKKDKILYL